jgi:hypothetical protein
LMKEGKRVDSQQKTSSAPPFIFLVDSRPIN